MKVLFDHQIFEYQKFGGISRYFFELINQFEISDSAKVLLPIKYSNNEYLKELSLVKNSIFPIPNEHEIFTKAFFGLKFKGKIRLYNRFKRTYISQIEVKKKQNKESIIEILKKGDFDVFHPTYYDPYFLNYIGNKPFVITVYDLIHEIFPEFFMGESEIKNKEVFERASKIIAISESTKNDLINLLGIKPDKIEVVYLGASLNDVKMEVNPYYLKELPEYYLLFIGKRGAYKNFYFFIQCFATLSKEYPNLEVVCTGPAFTSEEITFLKRTGISEKVKHFYASDSELKHLYTNAAAFVFPSQYEGFGLPVLEAFVCNCPALLSNTSSLPEVGGDAAFYFDPKNAESLISAMKLVLKEGKTLERMRKGMERASFFNWQKTAVETLNLYHQVIN